MNHSTLLGHVILGALQCAIYWLGRRDSNNILKRITIEFGNGKNSPGKSD